jgi:hypothetical protein
MIMGEEKPDRHARCIVACANPDYAWMEVSLALTLRHHARGKRGRHSPTHAQPSSPRSRNSGELIVGSTVRPMCVDQSRDALDDTKTVYEEMCGGADELVIGGRAISSRAYCTWYNFRGGDQQKRVGDLSGGERNRLQLAKTLLSGGNLLLLDGTSRLCARAPLFNTHDAVSCALTRVASRRCPCAR